MLKKKFWGSLVLFSLCFTTIAKQETGYETDMMKNTDNREMTQWVDSVFNSMSVDERIGQLIIIHVGGENTQANRSKIVNLVSQYHAGGILFSKGTVDNQVDLTNLAQNNAKVPLMITLDGEWGLSMRLENTTRFPKNMMLGAIQNDSLLYAYGLEVARQCREIGVQVNFAPDMDVNSNPSNPVIGIRSFGEDPNRVAALGIAYSKGLEAGNILSVAKHFPGHGDTSTDSHKTLPLISHTKERLENVEFIPFREYIGAGLGGIMTAHLNIPVLDNSGLPSSLSKPIVTELLQNRFGFEGLIFTDGLAMQGVANEKDMSVKAILAGNDLLLGPISPIKEYNALKEAVTTGKISQKLIDDRCKKILAYKYALNLRQTIQIERANLLSKLNTPKAEWINRKLNEAAITLVKNEANLLPLKKLNQRTIAVVSIGSNLNNPFQQVLKQYDKIDTYSASDAANIGALQNKLSKYTTVILAIHDGKAYSEATLRSLVKGKESILAFFTIPYNMSKYTELVNDANAVVVGYENTPFAQDYTAQGIFGGNIINGKLPVSIKGLFKAGTGISTNKTRLGYNMPEEVGFDYFKLNLIDNIAMEGISEQAYPGCQILVAKDGVVVYNRSFGTFSYNSDQVVTNDDLYDLASVTKAMATLPALMKLYDEKKIKLQSSLSKYIPILKNTDKEDITVRQALLHETGLPSFLPFYMPAIDGDSYSGRLFSNKQTEVYGALLDNLTWGRTDFRFRPNIVSKSKTKVFSRQVAEGMYVSDAYNDTIINAIANSKLRAKTNYLYSDLNFMLLKEAIENITGTDLNTFLQATYYEKLGAYTTTFNPRQKFSKNSIVPTEKDDFLRKQLLQGYVHDEAAAFSGGISGNAGLFSDANDLAKICQMYLNLGTYGGETFVSQETARLFTSTKSAKSRRGLGFDKPDPTSSKASPTSPSAPESTYGHTGFTGTAFWVDPDNNLIYIFLSNRVNETRANKKLMSLNIRPRIQEQIYKAMK